MQNITLVAVVLSQFFFLSLPQSIDAEFAKVIYVNKYSKDKQGCLEGNSSQLYQPSVEKSCQTIEYVADQIGNDYEDVKIIVLTDIRVSRTVRFQGGNKITIYGKRTPRKFSCNCFRTDSYDTVGGGFVFINVQQIQVYNISFVNCCGSLNRSFNASLVIKESSNITIERVTIRNNQWNSGIMLIDSSGEISIIKSTFNDNNYKLPLPAPLNSSFAAGIHMQFSGNKQTNVHVSNCNFEKNHSPNVHVLDPDALKVQVSLNGYSLGGGMGIVFMQQSNGTVIEIHNTSFKHNIGVHGGGLCVHFQDESSNNIVMVNNSLFTDNRAEAGGGLKLIIILASINDVMRVVLTNVTFKRNRAEFGGGLSLSALHTNSTFLSDEQIIFRNCTWRRNFGVYGSAIELSPFRFQRSRQLVVYLPIPLFKDCKYFDHEHFTCPRKENGSICHVTQGVFAITRFTVHFDGAQIFTNNTYSAVHLTSGRAVFKSYSEVLFSDNVGLRGGAISANGFSTIVVNDNSQFHFINNRAIGVGGAIYYASSDQREYFEGRSCFLEYAGNEHNLTRRNLSLNFSSNRARRGLAIYSASLFSCYFAYIGHFNNNIIELLDSIGDFWFDIPLVEALATGIRYVKLEHSRPELSAIPGKSLQLPLRMMDEFKSYVKSGYNIRVKENDNNTMDVTLSKYFTISNRTRVYGTPNTSTELILSTPQELYNIEYSVKVNLLSCPPGFFFEEHNKNCKCSADTQEHSYPSIPKCDHSYFRAFVYRGIWVGYYPAGVVDSDSLYTALFPFPYNSYGKGLSQLPNSSDKLTQFICGNNRIGTLCGKCKEGYSTYYHSKQFICGINRYCDFGILFYSLSDILSLTVFFTVMIVFGISLSSGSLNGLVFFSQILDLVTLDATLKSSDLHNNAVETLHNGYQLIYGIFNLDFFPIFPFCLWKGATIMDNLLFKYVTTVFAFILILLIVFLANCPNRRIKGLCGRLKHGQISPKASMIHGISTLLIVSYSQCTKATFSILKTVYLRSKEGIEPILVTYYGGLPYLEGRHIIYAIPAIVVCLTFVILPPLFLLLYPSLLHLLSLCNLSEHRAIHRLLNCMGINRLMPLFDSLQGCYKDKLRFFSGLYFLYRVALLVAFTFSELTFYLVTQFLLLFMLGVHSIVQPYRLQKHNIFDGLIFLNLAIINGITIIIKLATTSDIVNMKQKDAASIIVIQTLFAYLPIIVVLLFGTKQLLAKIVSKYKCQCVAKRGCDQQECNSIICSDIGRASVELREPFLL